MDVRVGGTNVGQKWRVTGVQDGDTPPSPQRVMLEVWLEVVQPLSDGTTQKVWEKEILSFDPELARELGEHLIEMANHAGVLT
jgi:hypothetical protein